MTLEGGEGKRTQKINPIVEAVTFLLCFYFLVCLCLCGVFLCILYSAFSGPLAGFGFPPLLLVCSFFFFLLILTYTCLVTLQRSWQIIVPGQISLASSDTCAFGLKFLTKAASSAEPLDPNPPSVILCRPAGWSLPRPQRRAAVFSQWEEKKKHPVWVCIHSNELWSCWRTILLQWQQTTCSYCLKGGFLFKKLHTQMAVGKQSHLFAPGLTCRQSLLNMDVV